LFRDDRDGCVAHSLQSAEKYFEFFFQKGIAYMLYYGIIKVRKGKEDRKMTRTELNNLINSTMDLVQKYLNEGDHEKVQMYVNMIADAQYKYWEEKMEEV
jgi:hypothetical protein